MRSSFKTSFFYCYVLLFNETAIIVNGAEFFILKITLSTTDKHSCCQLFFMKTLPKQALRDILLQTIARGRIRTLDKCIPAQQKHLWGNIVYFCVKLNHNTLPQPR